MSRTLRLGVEFDVADPFWVLVREAVYQHAHQQGASVFPVDAA